MNATKYYVSTCRLVVEAVPHTPSTWQDLFRILPMLRNSLSCTVCEQLLNEPYTPEESSCEHHVCRTCRGGNKVLRPTCSWCKDYSKYYENVQLRILIQSYRKLCAFIKITPIYQLLTTNTELCQLIQDIISESEGEVIQGLFITSAAKKDDDDGSGGVNLEWTANKSPSDDGEVILRKRPYTPRDASSENSHSMDPTDEIISSPVNKSRHSRLASSNRARKLNMDVPEDSGKVGSLRIKTEPGLHVNGQEDVGRGTNGHLDKDVVVKTECFPTPSNTPQYSVSRSDTPSPPNSQKYSSANLQELSNGLSSVNRPRGNQSPRRPSAAVDQSQSHSASVGPRLTVQSGQAPSTNTTVGGNLKLRSPQVTRTGFKKIRSESFILTNKKSGDGSPSHPKDADESAPSWTQDNLLLVDSKEAESDNEMLLVKTEIKYEDDADPLTVESVVTETGDDIASSVFHTVEVIETDSGSPQTAEFEDDDDDASGHGPSQSQLSPGSSGQLSAAKESNKGANKKKQGCRCGNATLFPGKLTCCGQRCPCYVDHLACLNCRCKGCNNPNLPGGGKKLPFANLAIAKASEGKRLLARNRVAVSAGQGDGRVRGMIIGSPSALGASISSGQVLTSSAIPLQLSAAGGGPVISSGLARLSSGGAIIPSTHTSNNVLFTPKKVTGTTAGFSGPILASQVQTATSLTPQGHALAAQGQGGPRLVSGLPHQTATKFIISKSAAGQFVASSTTSVPLTYSKVTIIPSPLSGTTTSLSAAGTLPSTGGSSGVSLSGLRFRSSPDVFQRRQIKAKIIPTSLRLEALPISRILPTGIAKRPPVVGQDGILRLQPDSSLVDCLEADTAVPSIRLQSSTASTVRLQGGGATSSGYRVQPVSLVSLLNPTATSQALPFQNNSVQVQSEPN